MKWKVGDIALAIRSSSLGSIKKDRFYRVVNISSDYISLDFGNPMDMGITWPTDWFLNVIDMSLVEKIFYNVEEKCKKE